MGLLTFVGRIVLVVTNIVFMLISLGLIVGGFILRFAHEVLREHLKTILDEIESSVNSLGQSTNFNTDNFELGSIVSNIATAMIVIGVVTLAFCFVGCCSACCNFTTIMLVYAIVLIVLVLAQVVGLLLVFQFPDEIKDRIRPGLESSLDEYQGLNGTTLVSIGWNWAMKQYECCGVESYSDFTTKTSWWARDTYLTPIACCKSLPSTTAATNECAGTKGTGSYQTIASIATLSNYDKGCLNTIWDFIVEDNKATILTGIAICLVIQIVLIIFAILVYKDRGIAGGLI